MKKNEATKILLNETIIGKVFIKEKEQQKIIGYFIPKIEDFNNFLWTIEPLTLIDGFIGCGYEQIIIKKFFTDKNGIAKISLYDIEKQKQYLDCNFKRVNEVNFVKFIRSTVKPPTRGIY